MSVFRSNSNISEFLNKALIINSLDSNNETHCALLIDLELE
jgi:hypothetical protein